MILLFLLSLLEFNFNVNYRCKFVFLKDLTGDGKKEIILLGEGKKIFIFYLEKNKFNFSLEKELDGNVVDFGDVCPEKNGDEIIVGCASGIKIFNYDGENISLLKSFSFPRSFLYYENSGILRKGEIVYAIDGNNLMLFFYPEKALILNKTEVLDTIPLLSEVRVSTFEDKAVLLESSETFSLKTSFVLPLIYFKDVDGDGESDLLQFSKDTLFIFLKKNGHFSAEKDFYLDLSFLRNQEKMEIFPPRIWIEDINKDGKADVIVSKGEIGMPFGKKSAIYLFLNKNGFFNSVPDQVLICESFSPEVHLADFNRDKKIDLLINTSGFNLLTIIKLILMKKIDLEYSLYLFEENSFTKEPVYSKTFSVHANVSEEGAGEIVDFSNDFDNDGYFDIFYFEKNKISIFKGKGKSFEKTPFFFYEIQTSPEYVIEDIDGNGNVDILFWRMGKKETEIWGFLR